MDDEKIKAQSAFDSILPHTHHLEIIKAAIPYINTSEQRIFSVYVKASELTETLHMIRHPSTGITAQGNTKKGNLLDMLNDIKEVCTNKEKETVNMIINFYNAYQMYRSYNQTFGDGNHDSQNNPSNVLNNIKDFLTPEQQQMFDTYSSILKT